MRSFTVFYILYQVLGMVGKVVKVYSDCDMRVCIQGRTWTFNPLCCVARPQDQAQVDNTTSAEDTPGCSKTGIQSVTTNNTANGESVCVCILLCGFGYLGINRLPLTRFRKANPNL